MNVSIANCEAAATKKQFYRNYYEFPMKLQSCYFSKWLNQNNFNYYSIPHCAVAQSSGMYGVRLELSLENDIFNLNGFSCWYEWGESPVRYVTQCIKINLFQYNPNHLQLLRYEARGIGHAIKFINIIIHWIALSWFWIRMKALSDDSICHPLPTI